jgi:AraC-like DNA-binding protein
MAAMTQSIKNENEALLAGLVQRIAARTNGTGDFDTMVEGLTFFRREAPTKPTMCMIEPSIVLVARGIKQMWIGGMNYRYDTSNFLLTSLDLPADSEVLAASSEEPCLGLTMKLNMRTVAELISQGELPPHRARGISSGVGIGTASGSVLRSFERLLELLDEPEAIPVLAPLVQREIHFRLLLSDQATRLRQIASVDSQGHRVARAIDWLKKNYSAPLRVEELAARVQMSAPTFHQHFRQLTSMSPLQYQKWLRLNEARRLMLNEHLDVSSASYQVGYESPSQFSREYSRVFGMPPKKDIKKLREANMSITSGFQI